MSVPVGEREKGQLESLTKARNLKTYTLQICTNENNFPKRYRWCLVNDIVKETNEICRYIVGANAVRVKNSQDAYRRIERQNLAYELTEVLLEDIDTAYAFFRIDAKRIEYWTKQVVELQSLIKAWNKSDVERYRQFLMSPNVGNANNARIVNPSGERNNNNANNSNGLAPDLFTSEIQVSGNTESRAIIKGETV